MRNFFIPNLFLNFALINQILHPMKNLKLIFALLTFHFSLFTFHSSAQVLCIYCYDQNDSISHGVHNLILNGGFENNNCGVDNLHLGSYCPNSALYDCNITNWTCIGGGINTYSEIVDSSFSIVVQGTKAAYFGNRYCNSCSSAFNDTSCLNNINCSVTSIQIGYPYNRDSGYGGETGVILEQTVNGLILGNTYVLEFWAGGEIFNSVIFAQKGLFAVDVGFGNIFLRDNPT